METTSIGLHAKVMAPMQAAEAKVREALAAEGFGVLSELDLQAILKEKTGTDIGPYRLLGACNPQFAQGVLSRWKGFGVYLPCTVALYEVDGATAVEAFDPLSIPGVHQQEDLVEIARAANQALTRALTAAEQA